LLFRSLVNFSLFLCGYTTYFLQFVVILHTPQRLKGEEKCNIRQMEDCVYPKV